MYVPIQGVVVPLAFNLICGGIIETLMKVGARGAGVEVACRVITQITDILQHGDKRSGVAITNITTITTTVDGFWTLF